MIDAYIVNLKKHLDRKNYLEKNIETTNVTNYLNIKFIDGVDGNNISTETSLFKICPVWFDPILKTGIRLGEIGCALSHYKCWLEFYNSGQDHAIFLEDDIYFINDKFKEKLDTFLKYPQDADIVYIKRNSLNKSNETNYNNNFINIKTSYWLCGYLLTKKGVEKIMKTHYLDNLITVDEFLPILYDISYLPEYYKYYNIELKGYALKDSLCFINLNENTFNDSSTFFSKYYKFNSMFTSVTSNINCSISSINRWQESCEKYSINYMICDMDNILKTIDSIDNEKYIIIFNSNYTFFINNPLELYLNNPLDYYYSNFENINDFIAKYNANTVYFCGKNKILKNILTNNNNNKNNNNIDKSLLVTILYSQDNEILNHKSILIDGINNRLLVNKYENYKHNKIYKSYGYKQLNNTLQYTYKIRVNLLIYINDYNNFIESIQKIDYPFELLDIHIYTELDITHNKYIIHKCNEQTAYKDAYNYYKKYDYIWFVNSLNIIEESSLLKDCINSNKLISSGLIIQKSTCFSNFWGDITSSGWYLRSNDYLNILNRELINVWNVPFICNNLLIKPEIFEKYNILENCGFTKNTLIIAHNLRKHNESMYLLNEKCYGYIYVNPLEEFNLGSWTEKTILAPEFYNFIYNNNTTLFNEIARGSDIWNFPFFSKDFCNYLINLAETNGNWSGGIYAENSIDKRINNIENIPTQDIHLKQLKLDEFWKYVVNNYFKKIMSHLYKYLTKDYNIAFIVKYDAENGQTNLKPHHDASVYTINIALNDVYCYEGGGVNFISKSITFVNKNVGWLILHPGRLTHYHEALPITKGKRYILVSFNN
jgi:GR25 family glycosyltransferase involved in LPS biosynthesis